MDSKFYQSLNKTEREELAIYFQVVGHRGLDALTLAFLNDRDFKEGLHGLKDLEWKKADRYLARYHIITGK